MVVMVLVRFWMTEEQEGKWDALCPLSVLSPPLGRSLSVLDSICGQMALLQWLHDPSPTRTRELRWRERARKKSVTTNCIHARVRTIMMQVCKLKRTIGHRYDRVHVLMLDVPALLVPILISNS